MNAVKSKKICLAALVLGCIGFFLRLLLSRFAVDEKGLLVRMHPLMLGLLAAGLLMLVLTAAAAAGMKKAKCTAPCGAVAGAGSLFAALGLVLTLLQAPAVSRPMTFLGGLAAAAMLLAGISQRKGRQPHFLTHGIFCIFLGLYLVSRYREWSQDPQLMHYMLTLLCGVAMMLYAFQMASGNLGQCSRRTWTVLAGLGAFTGLAGAAGTEAPALCLGGAVWMLSGLWSGTTEGTENDENAIA